MTTKNLLYYGDNLDILRRHIKDETVDLVYLDPPFNSNQSYNVLFREKSGTQSAAQLKAFEDTWDWDEAAEQAYHEITSTPGQVADAARAMMTLLGRSEMMAYLSMMAPRLVELRRVLKSTGSLYLHCDPVASHYLKLILDSVFGGPNFCSEIVWKRSSAHSDTKQGRTNYGHIHDVIFFYTKSDNCTWNPQFTPYEGSYVGRDYRLVDKESGRRFRRDNLTAARPGGDTEYEWRVKKRAGVEERWIADLNDEHLTPKKGWEYRAVRPYRGRYWAYSRDNMRKFALEGRLRHTFDGMPEYKRFLDEMPGVPLQDLWIDVPPVIAGTVERLGYATQKPEALLERIIATSSNAGDTVLDPFCGCGTTIVAAQKLKRRWIGIDITQAAMVVIKKRLSDTFGGSAAFDVIGEPVDFDSAEELAQTKPYQFQWWILGKVGARPSQSQERKGADRGVDGRRYFHDDRSGKTKSIIFSVKAGHVSPAHVRELRGTMTRENAEMAALLCMEPATKPMIKEAIEAGFYDPAPGSKRFPKLQILTVRDIFDGKALRMPPEIDQTFKKAEKFTPQQKKGLWDDQNTDPDVSSDSTDYVPV